MSKRYKVAVTAFAVLFAFLGLRWMFAPETAANAMGISLASPLAFSTARGDIELPSPAALAWGHGGPRDKIEDEAVLARLCRPKPETLEDRFQIRMHRFGTAIGLGRIGLCLPLRAQRRVNENHSR